MIGKSFVKQILFAWFYGLTVMVVVLLSTTFTGLVHPILTAALSPLAIGFLIFKTSAFFTEEGHKHNLMQRLSGILKSVDAKKINLQRIRELRKKKDNEEPAKQNEPQTGPSSAPVPS